MKQPKEVCWRIFSRVSFMRSVEVLVRTAWIVASILVCISKSSDGVGHVGNSEVCRLLQLQSS